MYALSNIKKQHNLVFTAGLFVTVFTLLVSGYAGQEARAASAVAAVGSFTEVDTLPVSVEQTEPEWHSDLESIHDAALLHAFGLEAELDNAPKKALQFLRKAAGLAAKDETTTFDLARISFESNNTALATDAAPFLALQATTPDAHLLRAYLNIKGGDIKAAAGDVAAVLKVRPDDGEALRLQSLVGRAEQKKRPLKAWVSRVQTGVQYDTNISVLPEDEPSKLAGERVTLSGLVLRQWRPAKGVALKAGLTLNGGPYLDQALARYNAGSVTVFAVLNGKPGSLRYRLALNATEVVVDDFSSEFMRNSGGQLELRWAGLSGALKILEPGVYADAAWRDFIHQGAAPDAPSDRDGLRVGTGFVFPVRHKKISAKLKLGLYQERAQGLEQWVDGQVATLSMGIRLKQLKIGTSVRYDKRDYSKGEVGRSDTRMSVGLTLAYKVSKIYSVKGGYNFMTSSSNNDLYNYGRQLAQLGLEAQW